MKKFIIGYGLNGGFGGIYKYLVIHAEDFDKAEKEAYLCASEEYEEYEGIHGLRSLEDIAEENNLDLGKEDDYEEALEYYVEEMERWLTYNVAPYSEERFNHLDELYFIEDLTLNQN